MWQCFIFILQHSRKLSSSNLHSMKLETNCYRCLHAKIGILKFSWKPERSPNSGRGDIHTVFSFDQNALDEATRRNSLISRQSSADVLNQSAQTIQEESTNENTEFNMKGCLLSWFCGKDQNQGGGEDKAEARRVALLSTKESKLGKMVVNINLILVLFFGIFIWGFYAWKKAHLVQHHKNLQGFIRHLT